MKDKRVLTLDEILKLHGYLAALSKLAMRGVISKDEYWEEFDKINKLLWLKEDKENEG